MQDIKETIGKNIRIIRKNRGLTLQNLSKQIGITHQQLSRIENGMGTSTATLERIATILEVDMQDLMKEPNETLHNTIPQTKNYISDQFRNQMYARLYEDVIKPTNDMVLDRFMEDVVENLVKDTQKIRNLMCTHAGKKESYEFTSKELENFCQLMFVDFADHAMRLSKNNNDNISKKIEDMQKLNDLFVNVV